MVSLKKHPPKKRTVVRCNPGLAIKKCILLDKKALTAIIVQSRELKILALQTNRLCENSALWVI